MTQNADSGIFQQKTLFDLNQDSHLFIPPPINDRERDEIALAIMTLASIKGVGFTTLCTLFDAQILHHFWKWDLSTLADHIANLPDKQKVNLAGETIKKRQKLEVAGREAVQELDNQQISILIRGHQDYPEALLRLQTPPRWIFVKGNKDVLKAGPIIGVVGTRSPSSEGMRLAYRFAKELAYRNAVVLSGLARGIDEQSHLGAVDHFGQSIAVLGHGLNYGLTQSNERLITRLIDTNGVVISEYLPLERPSRDRFLRRNELQAALSKVIVPVECPSMSSGTGATIRRALNIETEVIGIVPGKTQEKSLQDTRENLERLNVRMFTVLGQSSTDLWEYLSKKVPGHDWAKNLTKAQDKFFAAIEHQVLDKRDTLSLDDIAIERLIGRLRSQFNR